MILKINRLFSPKSSNVTWGSRKFHNMEHHNMYSSTNIVWKIESRRKRWTRHAEGRGQERNACKILVGCPEGKRTLRILMRR
jgi:hypothetical protein